MLVRNALLEFFPDLITTFGDVSALLSADFYEALRDVPVSAASFGAVMAQPPAGDQALGSVRWAVGPLFEANTDLFMTQILGSTQRLVLQAGRDTIWTNAQNDPVRTGVAIIPKGGETCRFCIMLASRGAVYADTALTVRGRGSTRSGLDADGSRLTGGAGGGIKARGKRALGAPKFHDDCDCEAITIRSRTDYPDGHSLGEYRRLYAEGSGVGRDIPTD